MLDAHWDASAQKPATPTMLRTPIQQFLEMEHQIIATVQSATHAPQRIRRAQKILIASLIPTDLKESVSTLGCVLQKRKICATSLMRPFLEVPTKEQSVAPPLAAVSGLKLESKLPAPAAQTVVAAWEMISSAVKSSIRSPFASLVNA